jgi:hypothetical protein
MSSLTKRLSETAPIWARAVAPVAEWVAQALWSSDDKSGSKGSILPTRLTHRHRTEGRGNTFQRRETLTPRHQKICAECGAEGINGRYCSACAAEAARRTMADLASFRHLRPTSKKEKARLSRALSDHAVANTWWEPSSLPDWLTEQCYLQQIQPRLRTIKVREISEAMCVSKPYAALVRAGRRHPHPRHWQALAELAGLAGARGQ